MNSEALEIEHLDAFYGRTQALFDLTVKVRPGTVTALLGANGAGKTTTLRAVSGFVTTRGRIVYGGVPTLSLRPEQVARLGIAHVPSNRGTFLEFSVDENLRLGAFVRRQPQSVRQDAEKMYSLFPRLAGKRRHQAALLSGGEQQMLAIARALMCRPRLLLLDEPSFGLAPKAVEELYALLMNAKSVEQVGLLLVEQNANLALDVADSVYLLESGRVVAAGAPSELRGNEILRRSYLG